MKRNYYYKQDKIKWIITSVAFVLAFVMIAGIFMQVFAKDEKYKPTTWFSKIPCVTHEYGADNKCTKCGKDKPIDKTADGDSTVISEGESHGMRLMSARLVSDEVASNDIEEQSSDQYELTAVITPANADNKRVIWSIAWNNPESAWVKSHNNPVTNYVSISSLDSATTNLTITVTCKYAFGEKIIITCTSVGNSSVRATCNVDYQRKFLGTRFKLTNGDFGLTLDKSQSTTASWRWATYTGESSLDAWGNGTNEYTPYYSIYTTTNGAVTPVSYSLTVRASDSLKAALDNVYVYNRSDYRRSYTYNFVNNYSGKFTQRDIMGSYECQYEGMFKNFIGTFSMDGDYDIFYAEGYSSLRSVLLSCSVDLIMTVSTVLSNGQTVLENFEVNIADDTLQVPVTGLSLSGNLVF